MPPQRNILQAGPVSPAPNPEPVFATHYYCALGVIQLQADKLLHTLPVLHLSGAVGVILTCLAVGALRLAHLLVHLGQSQPAGQEERNANGIRKISYQ